MEPEDEAKPKGRGPDIRKRLEIARRIRDNCVRLMVRSDAQPPSTPKSYLAEGISDRIRDKRYGLPPNNERF
jgi:hypothetical protein